MPNVDGARTPANNRPIPPFWSRSRSSIESAPASIPPTTLAVFEAGFGEDTDNSRSRSYRPADSARRSAGTRPAADTRLGSSKTGRIVWEAFTYEVSLARVSNRCVVTPILPPSKGILVLRHAHPTNITGGSGFSGEGLPAVLVVGV